jgi:hypothetical protein
MLPYLASAVPLLGTIVTWFLTKAKLQEIHVLVNSRLSTALDQIALLERKISDLVPGDHAQVVIANLAEKEASKQPDKKNQ